MRRKKSINYLIGTNIRAARERSGYTQEQFSEQIGMTPNHLSAIERGASGISLEALKKVCICLNVSADSILFEHSEANVKYEMTSFRRFDDMPDERRKRFDRLLNEIIDISE